MPLHFLPDSYFLSLIIICLPMLIWYGAWWLWTNRGIQPSNEEVTAIEQHHPARLRAMWKGEVDGKVLLLAAQEAVDKGVYELGWEGLDTARYRLRDINQFSALSPIAKRVFLQGGNRPLPELIIGQKATRQHMNLMNRLEEYFQAEFRKLSYPPALIFGPGFLLMLGGFSFLMTTQFEYWQLAVSLYPILLILLSAAILLMGDGFLKMGAHRIKWVYGLRVVLLLGLGILIDYNLTYLAYTPPLALILGQMWWFQRFHPSKASGIATRKSLAQFRKQIEAQPSATNQWKRWALDWEVPEVKNYERLMKHTSFEGHFRGSNWMSQPHWRDVRA